MWLRCFRRTPVLTSRFSTSGALRRFRGRTFHSLAKSEVYYARLISAHRDWFLPCLRFGEDWTLHLAFGQNVESFLFAKHGPAFVPCHNLIGSRRHVGEFELPALIGHCVVRVRNHHHFCVHPDM